MAEMYCPNCAHALTADAMACARCGAEFGPTAAWAPVPDPPRVPGHPPARPPAPTSPRAIWQWLVAGALYGLLLRVALAHVSGPYSGPMSVAFLVGVPLAVGAISVYGIPAASLSLLRAAIVPALPMTLMLVATAITLLEGSICIAIMAPLFYIQASIGGVCMAIAARLFKSARPTLCMFAALPVFLVPFDVREPVDTFHELHESVVVNAPAEVVWANIVSAKDIRRDELPASLAHAIGVPRPINAENRSTRSGETRFSQWENGVSFTAEVVRKARPRSIAWRYSFTPDSFPPGTMDDHVVLGGKHIDFGETTFNIVQLGDHCRLEVVGRYRLTTPVNFYAVPVSHLLGRDFLRTLLGLYKHRAERAAAAGDAVVR